MSDHADRVIAALSHGGDASASSLARSLGLDKCIVNRTLYALHELATPLVCKTDATPPIWSSPVSPGRSSSADDNTMLIFVDLGNVHDSLQELVPYARVGAVRVEAFADRAYNGFGVKPPLDVPNITVHRATGGERNAADVLLIWRASELLQPSGTKQHAIVVTKDQGFLALKDLAALRNHTLEFVTSWRELRQFVE